MDESPRLRVAIIGGGLAGATLFHALMKYSHLDLHVYEAGAQFSERGAAVGLSSNAQAALTEMDPSLIDLLYSAGAVRMNSTRVIIGSGPHAGETLLEMAKEKQSLVVHRAAFLDGLLRPVPAGTLHANKRLTELSENEDGKVTIRFEDGSHEVFDGVIGADGIHSIIRQYILGDHPASLPYFAGFWDCRFLVSIEKAREALGDEYFKEDRQYGWCGEGGFFMHDVLDGGESVQCVSSVMVSTWDSDHWSRALDQETLEQAFSGWTNSPIASDMIKLLSGNPDLRAYSQWHHEIDAQTFTRGHVCMMGDAAHAMAPWQGAGAGQAIEDAMILDALFGEVEDTQDLLTAFKVFDEVRRSRSQKIIHSSAHTGRIMCGREPGVGLNPERVREALGPRWGIIMGVNMKEYRKGALTNFRDLKRQGKKSV
ncbi:salicylate hydroxylase [Bisporella sp. PMI_857]|nr:salicylate hydroxylase [Bisporella sp. PMI_857]